MPELEKATFAGGCFWCMVAPFETLPGVRTVKSGYMGGHLENPTYEDVCRGNSGHAEVIQIEFDSKKVPYRKLLEVFWRNIDPTTENKQFVDEGSQYRTAIFFHSEDQKVLAMESKAQLERAEVFKDPIVTEITPASTFFPAEDYHQNYHSKNTSRYLSYRNASGRDEFLKRTWKNKS